MITSQQIMAIRIDLGDIAEQGELLNIDPNKTTLEWNRATMCWTVAGPFYPRYATLISMLTDFMREKESRLYTETLGIK